MLTFSSVIVIFVLLLVVISKKNKFEPYESFEPFTEGNTSDNNDVNYDKIKKLFKSFLGDPYIRENQGMRSCKAGNGKQICRFRGAISNNPAATDLIGEVLELNWPIPDVKTKYRITAIVTGNPFQSGNLAVAPMADVGGFDKAYDSSKYIIGLAGFSAIGTAGYGMLGGLASYAAAQTTAGAAAALAAGEGVASSAISAAVNGAWQAGLGTLGVPWIILGLGIAVAAAVLWAVYDITRNKVQHMDAGHYCGTDVLKNGHSSILMKDMTDNLITEVRLVLHFDTIKTFINQGASANKIYKINKTTDNISLGAPKTSDIKKYKTYNLNKFKVINTDKIIYTANAGVVSESEINNLLKIHEDYKKQFIMKANVKKFPNGIPTSNLYDNGVIFENTKFFLRLRQIDDLVNYILPKGYEDVDIIASETDHWHNNKAKSGDTTSKEQKNATRTEYDVKECIYNLIQDDTATLCEPCALNDSDIGRNTQQRTDIKTKIKDKINSEMFGVLSKLYGSIYDKEKHQVREVRSDGMDSTRCYYHLYPGIGANTQERGTVKGKAGTGDRGGLNPQKAPNPHKGPDSWCPNFRTMDADTNKMYNLGTPPKFCIKNTNYCNIYLNYSEKNNLALKKSLRNIGKADENGNNTVKSIEGFIVGDLDQNGGQATKTSDFANWDNVGPNGGTVNTKWSKYSEGLIEDGMRVDKDEPADFKYNYDNYIHKDGPGREILRALYKPIYFYVSDLENYDTELKNKTTTGKIRPLLTEAGYTDTTVNLLDNLTYVFPNRIDDVKGEYKSSDKKHGLFEDTYPEKPTTQFCAPYIRQVTSWDADNSPEDSHVNPNWAQKDNINMCLPKTEKARGKKSGRGGKNAWDVDSKFKAPLLTSQLNYIFGMSRYKVTSTEIIAIEDPLLGNDLTDGDPLTAMGKIATMNPLIIKPSDLQIQIDEIRITKMLKKTKEYDMKIGCKFTDKGINSTVKTPVLNKNCVKPPIKPEACANYCIGDVITVDIEGKKNSIFLIIKQKKFAKLKINMKFTDLNGNSYNIIKIDAKNRKITLDNKLKLNINGSYAFCESQGLTSAEQTQIYIDMKKNELKNIKNDDEWKKRMAFYKCYKTRMDTFDDDELRVMMYDINDIDPLVKNLTDYALTKDKSSNCEYVKNNTVNVNKDGIITKYTEIRDFIHVLTLTKDIDVAEITQTFVELQPIIKNLNTQTKIEMAAVSPAAEKIYKQKNEGTGGFVKNPGTINNFLKLGKQIKGGKDIGFKKSTVTGDDNDKNNDILNMLYDITYVRKATNKKGYEVYKNTYTDKDYGMIKGNIKSLYKQIIYKQIRPIPIATVASNSVCKQSSGPKINKPDNIYILKKIPPTKDIIVHVKVSDMGKQYNELLEKTGLKIGNIKVGNIKTTYNKIKYGEFGNSILKQYIDSHPAYIKAGVINVNSSKELNDCITIKTLDEISILYRKNKNATLKKILEENIPNNFLTKKAWTTWYQKTLGVAPPAATAAKAYENYKKQHFSKDIILDPQYIKGVASELNMYDSLKLKNAYGNCIESISEYVPS